MKPKRLMNLRIPLVGLFVLCAAASVIQVICHRGPSEEEIKSRYLLPPATGAAVNMDQADVGVYWIILRKPDGVEEFGLELAPQWLWPWSDYRWPE